MSQELFRKAALEARPEEGGRLLRHMPPAWGAIVWMLVTFVVLVGIGLVTLTFSRTEFLRGRLSSDTIEARVFAERAGVVESLTVELGSIVRKGDLIASVTTERITSSGLRIGDKTIEGLRREQAALQQRLMTAHAAADRARARYDLQISGALRQIDANNSVQQLAKERIALAGERLESVRRLELQGASSREESRAREDAYIFQKQQLADLQDRASILQDTVDLARLDKRKIEDDLVIQLAEIGARTAQLDQQIAQAVGEAGFSVVAPVTGRIAALQVAVGDHIEPSRPLLTILPEKTSLVAELFVPSRVVAQLATGQRVKLGIEVAMGSDQSTLWGSVTSISAAAFAPDEVRYQLASSEPVYRVVVNLDSQLVRIDDRNIALRSGMSLIGIVLLDQRSILDWIVHSLSPRSPSGKSSANPQQIVSEDTELRVRAFDRSGLAGRGSVVGYGDRRSLVPLD